MGTPRIEDAEHAYYALLRVLVRTAKNEGICNVPDFGSFKVIKTRRRRNVSGLKYCQKDISITTNAILKFTPLGKLKKHINS